MNLNKLCYWIIRTPCILIFSISSCDDSPSEIDCTVVSISLSITKIKYADCGQANGEIMVEATGGAEPYSYFLDQNVQNSVGTFQAQPGPHDIIAIDKNGCSSNKVSTYVGSMEPFQVQITTTSSGGCSNNQGTIKVTPLGGIPPYKYQLGENNDDYQSTGLWENLTTGRYSIWVEDYNECFFGVYTYVTSGISYQSTIEPIIKNNCATSGCHNGDVSIDLRSHAVIKANASKIKTMINDRSMPPNNSLLSSDIELITCWINDGTPNN